MMEIENWVSEAMALAGYRFREDFSTRDNCLVFERDAEEGVSGILRFEDSGEVYRWIEGFVMLSDNEGLNRRFEAIMAGERDPAEKDSAGDGALLSMAIDFIDEFYQKEFEEGCEAGDLLNLSRIPLAFTTCEEDELLEIQAYCDLVNFRIFTCLGKEEFVVRQEQYSDLQEMLDVVLPCLDFSELVSIADYELEDYREFQNENGDKEKLNDMLDNAFSRSGNFEAGKSKEELDLLA